MADTPTHRLALIVGAGAGLSASLARLFASNGLQVVLAARSTDDLASLARLFAGNGLQVVLAARSTDDLAPLAAETGAAIFACDATRRDEVDTLFEELDAEPALGAPDVVVYNASYRTRGPLIDLDPAEVEKAIRVSAFGGFLVAQAAARRMLRKRHGAILFTGASASVKGYAQSAPFAMGKFALRGLAQSLARELSPQGIHVAHVIVDGGIRPARRPEAPDNPDSLLDPDAIAQTYWHVLQQPKSAWTWEVELRPWVEKF